MIIYKMNLIEALKEKGYTTYRIRKEKLLSEASLTAIRSNKPISWDSIDKICTMLDCKIEDILEFKREG